MLLLMHPQRLTADDVLMVVSVAVWIGSGALLLLRARPSRINVLAGATLVANGLSEPVQRLTRDSAAPVGRAALGIALVLAVCTLCLFPDGRFVPGWLRWLAAGFAVWQAVVVVVGTGSATFEVLGGVVFFAGMGVPLGAQVGRYRREEDPLLRARSRWLIYGLGVAIGVDLLVSLPYFAPGWFPGLVATGSPYDQFQVAATSLSILAIPVCLTLGMVFASLFDVDVVITRTLVYATLSIVIALCYGLVVAGVGVLVGHSGDRVAPLVGAAVVAVIFGPSRARLQRHAQRLVYGLRAEPYAALSGLGRRLEQTSSDADVAMQLVSTIRAALRAPYVGIGVGVDGGYPIAAEEGVPTEHTLSLPLHHRGEQVGLLTVGHDAAHPVTDPDRALLADLASHAGSAIHGVQLTTSLRRSTTELQATRERLVLTREEERRRLRRDLHDGLAPTLAAAGLTASTASELLERDPAAAMAALDTLQRNLRSAVADIRTLVDELRPPALELGLVPAIRERVTELRPVLDGAVEAPDCLPLLAAGVEVAAYRICQEALMNVVKHAGATRVRVVVAADALLRLDIEDDGVGLGSRGPGGLGLESMRERAAEVGGRCSVGPLPGRGTRVSVRLPLVTDAARP
jgi:signal transduction histidine kinase